ncbi:CPBP family intramembrane glutamate endopeptidase, partial [Halobium palmae]
MNERIRTAVDAHPVAWFFVLTYAISWGAWLAPILGLREPLATLGYAVGGFGPFVAAGIVAW